jgi:Flp pilus assembly pilin Flp
MFSNESFRDQFARFLIEDGQGHRMAEYALIVFLAAMLVVGMLGLLGPAIGVVFNSILHGLSAR